jgi:predicted esterase
MYLKPNFAQLTLQTYPVGHEVTKDMENEIERYLKNDVLKQE